MMIDRILAGMALSICIAGAGAAQAAGRPDPIGFSAYSEISTLKAQVAALQQQVAQLQAQNAQIALLGAQNAGLSQKLDNLDNAFKNHTHTYKMTTFGFADNKLSNQHIGFDGLDEPTSKPK